MSDAGFPPVGATQAPGFYRFRIGAFEAIALHDGVVVRDRPAGFVRNIADADVGEAYAAAGMARDKLTTSYNALAINTGKGVTLIDTGLGEGAAPAGGMLTANLAAAGIRPEDVTTVIISHFHSDHIAGLRRQDGAPAFPNAEIAAPQPEWDFWMDDANMAAAPESQKGGFALARRIFGESIGDVRRFAWGEEILPGLTSVKAGGHTPGMSAIEIASGGEALLFAADVTNNPVIFARNPHWRLMFDMDPEEAIVTRRRLLDRAAADRLRLFFFHAPFPASGYVVKSGDGYEYIPAVWTAR